MKHTLKVSANGHLFSIKTEGEGDVDIEVYVFREFEKAISWLKE